MYRGAWWAIVHRVKKSQKQLSDFHFHGFWASLLAQVVKNLSAMKETWVRSLGQEDPLEKEMATHSSILASRVHGQRSLVGYSPWGYKELGRTE